MYWQLKRLAPSDPDFALESFSKQPYHYVILALQKLSRLAMIDKHHAELGSAQIASIMANQNRDPKKTKPFSINDFCFFDEKITNGDLPQGRYGAAALQMIKLRIFPSWALFCYKQLVSSVEGDYVPSEPLAFIAEDAILLHPMKTDRGWVGMLIAMESASNQTRDFISTEGHHFSLTVPLVHTKVVAEEDVILS